jgi:hypothetical protein
MEQEKGTAFLLKEGLQLHQLAMDEGQSGIVLIFEGIENVAVKNKDGQHLFFLLQGIKKCGIVFYSQVATKPKKANFFHDVL